MSKYLNGNPKLTLLPCKANNHFAETLIHAHTEDLRRLVLKLKKILKDPDRIIFWQNDFDITLPSNHSANPNAGKLQLKMKSPTEKLLSVGLFLPVGKKFGFYSVLHLHVHEN